MKKKEVYNKLVDSLASWFVINKKNIDEETTIYICKQYGLNDKDIKKFNNWLDKNPEIIGLIKILKYLQML